MMDIPDLCNKLRVAAARHEGDGPIFWMVTPFRDDTPLQPMTVLEGEAIETFIAQVRGWDMVTPWPNTPILCNLRELIRPVGEMSSEGATDDYRTGN